jgi:hypothetical protein
VASGGGRSVTRKARKAFFSEEKNQKTFPTGSAGKIKSFLLLFFKKEALPSLADLHA